jgi:hypothetical protein
MLKYPWQEAVVDAACEFVPQYLQTKLENAEALVRARMAALREDGNDPEEFQALVEALEALRKLERVLQ